MSKVIKISKHKLDLAHVELTGPSLLVGRSPLCDQVLRAPGVLPIQFLLEWIGEGEFNPNAGMWTLFDMGHLLSSFSDPHYEQNIHSIEAEGVVLDADDRGHKYLGFNWSIIEDRLNKTHIQKGLITKQIKESAGVKANLDKLQLAIEIVRLDKKHQKVIDVAHFFDSKNKTHHFNHHLPIGIVWKKSDKVQVRFSAKPLSVMDLKGNKLAHGDGVILNLQDTLIAHFEHDTYLVRFVSRVNFLIENESIFQNKFILTSLMAFILFIILLFGIDSIQLNNVKNIETPEVRVVKILEVPPPKIVEEKKEIAPEIIKEEIKPESIKEEIKETKVENLPDKVEMIAAKKEILKPKKTKTSPLLKGNDLAAKNVPKEKVTDVNSVGLLAKFKTQGALNTKQISAESISKTLVNESKNNGGVLIQTSQLGVVGNQNQKEHKNYDNLGDGTLDEAVSNVKSAKEFSTDNSAPLAKAASSTGVSSLGSQLGKSSKGTLGKAGNGTGNDGGEINGGLTKNQVFAVINEHRREIRTCYESALLVRNDLNGIMRLSFGINVAGSVTDIKVVNSELNSSILESCITQVIRQMKFPESQNQLPTTVIYPFVFKRSS